MEKWVKGLTDFFLLCSFFFFLPCHYSLMDHPNQNSHHTISYPILSPNSFHSLFYTLSLLLLYPLFLLSSSLFITVSSFFSFLVSPHCSCVVVTLPSALARSVMVTAVHSPVPYCGAVHHLHAFSVLQQNEFLIGPERRDRSRKRRWLSLLSPHLCMHGGMSQCKSLITVSTALFRWN